MFVVRGGMVRMDVGDGVGAGVVLGIFEGEMSMRKEKRRREGVKHGRIFLFTFCVE